MKNKPSLSTMGVTNPTRGNPHLATENPGPKTVSAFLKDHKTLDDWFLRDAY